MHALKEKLVRSLGLVVRESCQSFVHKHTDNLQQYEPVQRKSYTVVSKTARVKRSKSMSECGGLQGNGRCGYEAPRAIMSPRYM